MEVVAIFTETSFTVAKTGNTSDLNSHFKIQ